MPVFLTLVIVVLTLVLFVVEWVPADITALIIAVGLMALGPLLTHFGLVEPDQWITPEDGIAGFGNTATITVLAMFIMSAGIARTGAMQKVSAFLAKWGGKNPTRQIFVLGAVIAPIHLFIVNTAVVAVFLPVIEDWCKKIGISVSRLLIPLSYITVMGGMITVLGTSTNVLASGLSEKLGYGGFHLFQFTALGVMTFLVGLIYLAFFAPRLLPDRKPPVSDVIGQDYQLKEYVSEVVIPPGSSLIGQTLRSTSLQRKFDIDVLELIHNGGHFPQPIADKTLSAGDILLVRGKQEELLKIKTERGLDILPDVKFGKESLEDSLTSDVEGIGEVMILDNSNLLGSTLKDSRFRQRYNATVLAIRRGQEVLRERLGKIPLRFGDLLLVQGPKQSFVGFQSSPGLLLIEQRDVENLRVDKSWVSVGILISVMTLAAFDLLPIVTSALIGAVLMVLTGCLKPGELYNSVRWDIIFLLAGLIPLGTAMDKSGATQWLADTLVSWGGELSGFWILVFFYIITSLLTEILSNNAAVLLMLPVAVKVAVALSLNPFAFMYAVTFSASNSFLTPIGYQTNTMVYGPGGYKFLDFTRVGLPLNIILTFLTPLLIVWLYGL